MARIALGSNVREGPRRGKVVGHRPQGMVDVQFEDVEWIERRQEKKLRKSNPVGKEDYQDPAMEQLRRVQMAIYESQRERGIPDKKAWKSSFAIAKSRLNKYGWTVPGKMEATPKGKMRAAEKLASADSWAKEQKREVALARHRKSGKHRVVAKKHGKQTRYYVQPGGRYFLSRKKAEGLRDHLNTFLEGDVLEGIGEALVANPYRENWVGTTAAVLTIGDLGIRAVKGRRKKKKEKKIAKALAEANPRWLDERGGMGRDHYDLHRVARNALSEARDFGEARGKLELRIAQVPDTTKASFVKLRRQLEHDLYLQETRFHAFLGFIIGQIPSGKGGKRSEAQRKAMGALRRAERQAYSEVLLAQERKRAARKARKAKNPKQRMKGIAKAGVGYHWGDVRGTKPYQGMKPTLFREGKTFYLVYEGKSRKIPRVISAANRASGLKGPKWKKVRSVTAALWKDVQESASRYSIAHPESGRGSKSDPYRIYDKEKGRFFRKTFTRKDEAEKFLWAKQGGTRRDYSVDKPREEQVRSDRFAGEQVAAYSTTSLSRAEYIVANLTFLDVAPGVFERKEFQSRVKVEQTGPYRIHRVTERPPVGERRRFFPKTYTLVVPGGTAFENRSFKTPEAAVTFALRQRVSEDGGTLRQDLQALGKAMPRYKRRGEAEAELRSYVRYLRLYGFDVEEESEGKGKEKETWYTVKTSPKGGSFAGAKIVPVTLTDRYIDKEGRERKKKRKAFALQAQGTGGGTIHLGSGTKAEMEKLKKAKMKAKPSNLPTKAKAQREINRLQSIVDKAQDAMERRGTPGRPGFVLLAHGAGGSVKFDEEGFDLTGPVGKVTVSLDREPKVEQIWISDAADRKYRSDVRKVSRSYQAMLRDYDAEMEAWERLTPGMQEATPKPVLPSRPEVVKRWRRSLGHADLDWMAALYSKRTGLSRSQKKRLREKRQERADSELMTPMGRSPGVKAPSKRRAQISQFQYQIRETPQERKYVRGESKPAKRKSRKLTDRERKRAELEKIRAEMAKIKNPRRRNTAYGSVTRKSDLRPDERYTIWLKMPSGGYVIERSYLGRYIRDALWNDIKAYNKANRRQYVVVGHGVDPNTGYRQNYLATGVRAVSTFLKTPVGRKIAAETAVVAMMVAGDKLMKKGKVAPEVIAYIQRRVEQKTKVKPSEAQVTKVLAALDSNKDNDLTDAEIIEAVRLLRKK